MEKHWIFIVHISHYRSFLRGEEDTYVSHGIRLYLNRRLWVPEDYQRKPLEIIKLERQSFIIFGVSFNNLVVASIEDGE